MPGLPCYAVLEYVGQAFAGWQRQPEARTVQSELETVLERLTGSRVVTHAAGRTDAGVHALGQVVSFDMPERWAGEDVARAVNALLPPDMRVVRAGTAPQGFHARRHATARLYRYIVGCDPGALSPFRRPYEWALALPLDAAVLAEGAAAFLGEHDFRAYSAVGQVKPHYRCRVVRSEWQARERGEGFIFHIEADRFLHRMVRFLVGGMVDAARGRRPVSELGALLQRTDNAQASAPAPPEGLYLVHVRYPQLNEGSLS